MGWPIVAAAAVGAIMAGMRANSANAASARIRSRLREAYQTVSPSRILRTAQRLTPQMRELLVAQLGPGFQQNIQALISRSGLRGTGLGTAFESAAFVAPELAAFQEAVNRAIQIRSLQAQLKAGGAALGVQRESVAGAAVLGAAQGAFGAYAGGGGGGGLLPAGWGAGLSNAQRVGVLQGLYPDLRPGSAPAFPGITSGYRPPPPQFGFGTRVM